MKKHILAVLIASTIGLTACGDETGLEGNPTISYESHIAKSLQAPTKVDFTLLGADANIPLPSFMLMDTTDGTLNIPDGGDSSLSNPKVAMGAVDGWSPSQPIIIPFIGVDLEPTSAAGSVYMLKVDDPRKGADMQILEVLDEGTHFVAQPKGSTLYIQPMKPLDEKSNYIFAVTNKLSDTQGKSVGLSSSYAELKTKMRVQTIEPLKTAQGLTYLIEGTFAAKAGVDAESIIYSSWFTTASVGDVLDTTKTVIAQSIATGNPGNIWKGEAKPKDLDLSTLYSIVLPEIGVDLADAIDADLILTNLVKSEADPNGAAAKQALKDAYATYKAAGLTIKVYKGTVDLPYFLNDDTTNEAWKKTPWESAVPSLAKIGNVMESGTDADKAALAQSLSGVDIAKLLTGDPAEMVNLIGLEGKLADGSQLDSERQINWFSPIPKIKSMKPVPVLVFMPESALIPDDDGPGVVIYQHGITSVKETAYLFAANHMGIATLTNGGGAVPTSIPKAVIAIDHPLHGERALLDKDGKPSIITTPTTADVYMNLEYLNVARDNIRQSIIDGLGLRASLTNMKLKADPVLGAINLSKISFFGHSLGAITGIGTYGFGNQSLPAPLTPLDSYFNFSSGAFANPGGGIPSLLLESKTFGPTIKHSLLIGAENAAYESVCGSAVDGGACFTGFFDELDTDTKGEINGTLSSFAYAAQTVLDTVDPYNLASSVEGPVYVMQAHLDSVVPNQTTTFSKMGGTQPLVKQLSNQAGLAKITVTQMVEVQGIAEFNKNSEAQHSSAIAPQYVDGDKNAIDKTVADNATKEAQTEIATFIALDGQGVVVGVEGGDLIN
ncbi:fumarate hydrolyase [Photobacterium sagamiensis]|uniref:VolA/Pla-1 family phospholipase n=1 Tax=Photobacterium sagamiensis TaxID=2910241 RepID=UPI003D0EC0AA